MQKGGEEQEELHPGQTLTNAGPLSKGEGNKVVCFLEAAIFIQKVSWIKLLWVGKLLLIQHDGRQHREYSSTLGDDIVSEFCVLDHSMGQTGRKESDVSLNLMQYSIGVRQLHLVLHAGGLVASNHTVKFLMNFGLHLWILHKEQEPESQGGAGCLGAGCKQVRPTDGQVLQMELRLQVVLVKIPFISCTIAIAQSVMKLNPLGSNLRLAKAQTCIPDTLLGLSP